MKGLGFSATVQITLASSLISACIRTMEDLVEIYVTPRYCVNSQCLSVRSSDWAASQKELNGKILKKKNHFPEIKCLKRVINLFAAPFKYNGYTNQSAS